MQRIQSFDFMLFFFFFLTSTQIKEAKKRKKSEDLIHVQTWLFKIAVNEVNQA